MCEAGQLSLSVTPQEKGGTMMMNKVKVRDFTIGGGSPLVLMAGPCVLEEMERCLLIGRTIKEITARLGIPYIFKASFDKANRSSFNSFRGPGLKKGLEMLQAIKEELDVPVVTDVHKESQIAPAAKVVDVLQIPAFLCRQTDLIYAAAKSGCVVNVKKGQFLAPRDMGNVVDKLHEGGCSDILLTERGASFGYNNLVVDMRSFPIMRTCSCRAARARRRAATANTSSLWHAPPSPPALTDSSWKCTTIPKRRSATARTASTSTSSKSF